MLAFLVALVFSINSSYCSTNNQLISGEESQICPLDNQLDYIKLAVQWQPGYCQRSGCKYQPRFSIHGLWPGRMRDKMSPNSCCARETFDETKLTNIRDRLLEAWPSMRGSHSNFWRHEYSKHGTCTRDLPHFGSLESYFKGTIEMFDQLQLDQALQRFNIRPSNFYQYDKQDLLRVLTSQHQGRRPDLDCERAKVTNASHLKEIRFCFAKLDRQPIDCPQATDDCASRVMLLE